MISIQGQIAGLQSQFRELDRQAIQHKAEGEKLKLKREALKNNQQEVKEASVKKNGESSLIKIESAEKKYKNAKASLEILRRRLTEVAGKSGEWVQKYQERSLLRQEIQKKLKPLQEEQQQLNERLVQINERLEEIKLDQKRDLLENQKLKEDLESLEEEWQSLLTIINNQKNELDQLNAELSVQQRTRIRLENDQTKLEKDIARLESRKETLQESRGTGALRILLESGLDGIHGAVANLGEVETRYRLALEVAAGARIGHIVVDDDLIAAKAIDLLIEHSRWK